MGPSCSVEKSFLVTDIQGSTRLWEENPDAMREDLAVHDALLREVIASNGGSVFKSLGDAVYSVFDDPNRALAAASESQVRLNQTSWQSANGLKVRIVVNAGDAEWRNGDYFGQALNRCARLLSVCNGGQTLVSARVHASVSIGVWHRSLRSLGAHRLRDLGKPEEIFQLVIEGLQNEFPAIKGIESRPNNLPIQISSFVGRQAEISELRERLRESRLLTLVGMGGSGKTRLALQVGAEELDSFEDGVWLVSFDSVSDARLVESAVCSVLGLLGRGCTPSSELLIEHLSGRAALLILDNCEHLLEPIAAFTARVLTQCPEVKILATGRERLHVHGEIVWRVPPLGVPASGSGRSQTAEAVQLFCERAAAVHPGFVATAEDEAITQIVRELDGLPLLIELAAARVTVLSPQQIAAKLRDRIRLLSDAGGAAPVRHRTFSATMDWSYEGLTTDQQAVFRQFSVFAGGCSLSAIEAVCGNAQDRDAFEGLAALVEKSLVIPVDQPSGERRYRMLAPVREYAQHRLDQVDESSEVKNLHLAYFEELAREGSSNLSGGDQKLWLERLETDHDNLRACLAWCSDPKRRLTICYSLARFWFLHAHLSEAQGWLQEAISNYPHKDSLRAKALGALGSIEWARGSTESADEAHTEALDIWKSLEDRQGMASALNNLALVARAKENLAETQRLLEESVTVLRELEDSHRVGIVLTNLMGIAQDLGDFARADQYAEDAISHLEACGDWGTLATTYHNWSTVRRRLGDERASWELLQKSLQLSWEMDNKGCLSHCLQTLAIWSEERGDVSESICFLAALERLQSESGIKMLESEEKDVNRIWQAFRRKLGDVALEEMKEVAFRTDLKDTILGVLESKRSS